MVSQGANHIGMGQGVSLFTRVRGEMRSSPLNRRELAERLLGRDRWTWGTATGLHLRWRNEKLLSLRSLRPGDRLELHKNKLMKLTHRVLAIQVTCYNHFDFWWTRTGQANYGSA